MQSVRTAIRRAPQQVTRITKPTSTTISRNLSTTPATMSLFPRFTQEFGPIFRLFDEYDRHAFRDLEQMKSSVRSFTPKFDVKETQDAYELHGELPGVEQKDVNIEWSDSNTLTVSGRHEHVREEGQRPQGFIQNGGNGQQKSIEAEKAKQPSVEDADVDESSNKNTNAQVAKHPSTSQEISNNHAFQNKYWVSERSVGEFHRSFAFPARVEQDAVKASLKNGILSVVVPKARKVEKRRIEIES